MTTVLKNTIHDLVSDFLYYDRKEDDDLPVGRIEEMIEQGQTSVNELVEEFRQQLVEEFGSTLTEKSEG